MRITLSARIGGAILGLGVLLLVCGWAGYYAANQLSNGLDYVTTTAWDAADGSMEGTIALQGQIITLYAFAEETNPAKMRLLIQRLEDDIAFEEESLSRMINSGLLDDKTIAELSNMRKTFTRVREDMIEAVEKTRRVSDEETASALYATQQKLKKTVEALLEFLEGMEELGDSKVENYAAELESVQSVSFGVLIGTVVVGVVLALLAFLMVVSSVIKPIKQISQRFRKISEGKVDLTVPLPEHGDHEMTDVSRGFNLFVSKTRSTIQQVIDASNKISGSVAELTQINSRSNQSIERQEQETEQVATAMNEMAATLQEVARNVNDAAQAANKANEESLSGQDIVATAIGKIDVLASEVQQAAEVLHRVEDDSQKVGTVLDVIKDIAEQTNLLALNAAIEAARAGEQGRGFAVVADEVRTLAGRTQQSTEEIQTMIESLQNGTREAVNVMERGKEMTGETVEQANKAGEALQVIADAVATITNMTAQVASAAEEQNAVAEEINTNILNISDLAQTTGEASQESNTAAAQLSRLSEQLHAAVSQFKV